MGKTSLVGFLRDMIMQVMTAITSTKMKTKTNDEQNKMRKNLCTPKKRKKTKLTCPLGGKMVVGVVAQIANIATSSGDATELTLTVGVMEFASSDCVKDDAKH